VLFPVGGPPAPVGGLERLSVNGLWQAAEAALDELVVTMTLLSTPPTMDRPPTTTRRPHGSLAALARLEVPTAIRNRCRSVGSAR
jgi:hypothetical protein